MFVIRKPDDDSLSQKGWYFQGPDNSLYICEPHVLKLNTCVPREAGVRFPHPPPSLSPSPSSARQLTFPKDPSQATVHSCSPLSPHTRLWGRVHPHVTEEETEVQGGLAPCPHFPQGGAV